ncbi:MAG: geranylgeranyl diphosphate reductase [Pseudomonadota bacterium]
MTHETAYDVIVIGGGPSGATAAEQLARSGVSVALVDKAGRIKPCGGAIPPRLVRDYAIPNELIVARIDTARVIAPSENAVDMHIEGGYVGMVDREHFDEWLRARAADAGAERVTAEFLSLEQNEDGSATVILRTPRDRDGETRRLCARCVIGADGARSKVAKEALPKHRAPKCVFAYHEIVEADPHHPAGDRAAENNQAAGSPVYSAERCDVYYQGEFSPDFYAWVFPHGKTASIGTGSANKGFALRRAVEGIRRKAGLDTWRTIRREGAPIPMKPRRVWDNGRNVLLAGDAAGVVAPASGEGIYYAMLSGEIASDAVLEFLATGEAKKLATARRRFMRLHGRIFWILGIMQYFWYTSENRRERFVRMCEDPDVQRITWQSYMHKELVSSSPVARIKIFLKDTAHLLGMKAA